jgi:hypothetical protein
MVRSHAAAGAAITGKMGCPHAAPEVTEAAAPEATEAATAASRRIAARRRTPIRRRARPHGGIGEELAARMNKKRRVYQPGVLDGRTDSRNKITIYDPKVDSTLFGSDFGLRIAECLAQCLNLEHELRHTASKPCILGFEPLE